MRTLSVALIVLAFVPATASATFPGRPGKIAFTHDRHVFVVNPDGTGLHQLADAGFGDDVKTAVAIAPGGKRIAYEVYLADADRAVVVVNASTGNLQASTIPHQDASDTQRPTSKFVSFDNPQWSDDGKKLYTTCKVRHGGDVWQDLCSWTGKRGARPRQVTHCRCYGDNHPTTVVRAAGGRWAAKADFGSITLIDLRTNKLRDLFFAPPGGPVYTPSFSPDAKRIIFRVGSSTDKSVKIVTVKTRAVRLLDVSGVDPSSEFNATWSPDGKRIALILFGGDQTAHPDGLYTVAADGTGLRPIATGGFVGYFALDWAPR